MKSRVTVRTAFAALMVAFIFHNIEEAIFICRYPVQSPLTFIESASCRQFLVAVSMITTIVLIAFVLAIRAKNQSAYLFVSTAIAASILLNVLIPHVFVALYSMSYTPGLVTGVLLILPTSGIVLFKNSNMFSSRKKFIRYTGYGLATGYLIFAITMKLVFFFIP